MSVAALELAPPDEMGEVVAMLRSSAAAFLRERGGVGRARQARFSEPGFDRALWSRMAALGWVGVALPEASGGSGLGMAAVCGLAEELGAVLAPEPLIETMLAAALMESQPLAAGTLADLLAGQSLVLVAWQEQHDGLQVPAGAAPQRLFVPQGFGADRFLVPMVMDGDIALIEVDARDSELQALPTQDGGMTCMVRGTPSFQGRLVARRVADELERHLLRACVATSAYLLGLSDAALALTLSHLRQRRQFGRPIGSFQVLRHRAADLKMAIELLRSAIEDAAVALDADAPLGQQRRCVSRAKARAAETTLRVTREAIQMHGALGYTDDHDIGLYYRKSLTLSARYGSAAWHRRRFAEEAGFVGSPIR